MAFGWHGIGYGPLIYTMQRIIIMSCLCQQRLPFDWNIFWNCWIMYVSGDAINFLVYLLSFLSFSFLPDAANAFIASLSHLCFFFSLFLSIFFLLLQYTHTYTTVQVHCPALFVGEPASGKSCALNHYLRNLNDKVYVNLWKKYHFKMKPKKKEIKQTNFKLAVTVSLLKKAKFLFLFSLSLSFSLFLVFRVLTYHTSLE